LRTVPEVESAAVITVACVLRLGGDFSPEWVWALKRAVGRHLHVEHEFRCISDAPAIGMWRIPLAHPWPRWWAKLALFEPGTFTGPVLYMDLDSLPVGDLCDLASYAGPLALLSDLYQPRNPQSGVMAWTPGPHTDTLWHTWMQNPAGHMRKYRGDGEWIGAHAGKTDRLQTLYPGQIFSLKREAKKGPPPGARLVCGHGKPRLNTPAAGWAHRAWLV
jgi:hypothetical protein